MSEESEDVTKITLDGGVLISLAVDDVATRGLKKEIFKGEILPLCSELAIVEMEYILCRKLGSDIAEEKRRLLLESKAITIVETGMLLSEVAKMKCERALSLPDCFTLALAKIFECKALFLKREKEIEEEIKRKSFDVEVSFIFSQIKSKKVS